MMIMMIIVIIISTMNSNNRIVATLYSLGTIVCLWNISINTVHKGDDDDDDDNNNNNYPQFESSSQ